MDRRWSSTSEETVSTWRRFKFILLVRFSLRLFLSSSLPRASLDADSLLLQVSSIPTNRTPKSSSSPPKRFVELEDCSSIERVTDSSTSWVTEITFRKPCLITTSSPFDSFSTVRQRRKSNGIARFVHHSFFTPPSLLLSFARGRC